MAGEPCIKGTRVMVAVVVASMADTSIDEALVDYPQVTREDIQAALMFAAEELRKQYGDEGRMKRRKQNQNEDAWRKRIVCDPAIQGGEPCIKGTRVRVAVIVASLADVSMEELLENYPQLSREDVRSALLYAAQASHNDLVA